MHSFRVLVKAIAFVCSLAFIALPNLDAQFLGDESENGLESVDIDGDGDLDVVSLSAVDREFRIFINNNGTYDKIAIQSFPEDGDFNVNGVFTINDFNNDGAPDVVIVLIEPDGEYMILSYINVLHTSSTTSNNFESNPDQDANTFVTMTVGGVNYFRRQIVDSNLERIISMDSGDIAADGDMDLIYAHLTTTESLRRARWLRGSSSGSGASTVFSLDNPVEIRIQPTPSPVGGNINGIRDVYHLRLADLNGDIYPDLVSYSVGDVFNPPPFNGIDIPAIHTYGYDASPGENNFLFIEEDIGAVEINNADGSINTPNGFEIRDLDGDGDLEMIIVSTNPTSGITNILVAGDNQNDNTFFDIEIPISLGDFTDFELVDTDNDGVVDQIVVLTNNITATDTTSTVSTYTFQPTDNNGSGTDAFVLDTETVLDEPAFAIVIVQDENGNSIPVTDSDDTSTLSPPPNPPAHTTGTLIGDESANGMISIDIDGDGDEDVFSASNREKVLRWFRNNGNGSFTAVTIDTPLVLNGVLTAADFNGDDVIDVAVVIGPDSNDEYDIHIYLNMLPQESGSPSPDTGDNFETGETGSAAYTSTNGFRRFLAATEMDRITSMVNIDLNNDADLDIIFTQFNGGGRTQRLTNENNESIDRSSNFNTGRRNRNVIIIRVGDYNNDDNEDLVYVSEQSGDPRLVISRSSASGGFSNNTSTVILNESTVNSASDLALVNLDGDVGGDFEIVLANTDENGITSIVILGDTINDDTFDDIETSITGISNFLGFTITDADGDEDRDLTILTTDEGAGTSQVITYIFADDLNNGSGQDAYTAGDPINLGELSFGIVIAGDDDGNISIINDTDNTAALIEKIGNRLNLDYFQGWNLIAQPGQQIAQSNYFETIESPDLPVFFELQSGNTFGLAETPVEGVGYWVFYDSDPAAVTVTAKINNKTTVDISEGWNLIGSGSRKTSVQVLYDLYPSVANDGLNIFAYNGASSSFLPLSNTGTADSLRPGQGYYFEAPTAVNNVDINGLKIAVPTDETIAEIVETVVPFYLGINERYEQKMKLNFSREIRMPPSMTAKKSWLLGINDDQLFSNTDTKAQLYYESDVINSLTIRLDSVDQAGYLLIDEIFKVYPNYSLSLPYKDLSGIMSLEWVSEAADKEDGDTLVGISSDDINNYETKLAANYPNPFNPTTTIPYSISEPQDVVITIYNMSGQRVWVNNLGVQSAGRYAVTWNAANMASGVYLVEMRTSKNIRQLRRMTLMK
jgi:hypothetical protein